LAARRAFEKQQRYIQQTEDYIRRFKAGIKSKQARGRQSQLERLDRLEDVWQDRVITDWQIKMKQESGQDVLSITGVSKSFRELKVLNKVDMQIHKGEKIALVGPNGCGKTTLLKMITGQITPDEGTIKTGSRVEIAYFSQEHEDLQPEHTLLEELLSSFDMTIEEARSNLGRMLFSEDDVFKTVSSLSGGERGRLALLKVILAQANFLLLDEPTNHLDIPSREVVEDMLAQYPGTILMVSHDRYFIDQVADKICAIEDQGLEYYWGNYSYYREKLQERANLIEEEKQAIKKDKERSRNNSEEKEQQRANRRLQKELDEIEARIEVMEKRKNELESDLSDPSTYENMDKSRALTSEYQQIQADLTQAYARWEQLTEMLG
ncbi:MAG: ABC-F family ATP-binding cassette domain-containing protein, partial [Syntrophomonadaceae bacterium]